MPTDRAKLTAYLDEDTYDTWHAFADAHGVTMSSLLEALGRQLDPAAGRPPIWLRRAIVEARAIAAERRDRRPQE